MMRAGPARIKPFAKSGCESGGEAFVAMMQAADLRDFDCNALAPGEEAARTRIDVLLARIDSNETAKSTAASKSR